LDLLVAYSHQYLVTSSLAKSSEVEVVTLEKVRATTNTENRIHKTQMVVQHLPIQVIILNVKFAWGQRFESSIRVRIDTLEP